MKQDEIDRALSDEIEIVPSSRFVSGVMAAVRRSAPPPIPFPWKRALPGLAAGVIGLVAMLLVLVRSSGRPTSAAPIQSDSFSVLVHAFDGAQMYGIGWILLAIFLTLACVTVSMRLTTGTWRTP